MCKPVSKISCVTTLRSHQNFYTKFATDSAYLSTFISTKGETLSYTRLMREACVQLSWAECSHCTVNLNQVLDGLSVNVFQHVEERHRAFTVPSLSHIPPMATPTQRRRIFLSYRRGKKNGACMGSKIMTLPSSAPGPARDVRCQECGCGDEGGFGHALNIWKMNMQLVWPLHGR